jgi:hypothetical protein
MLGNSRVAERVVGFQDGLSSTELVYEAPRFVSLEVLVWSCASMSPIRLCGLTYAERFL